jgi:xanthine dehydrogenase accessory factor
VVRGAGDLATGTIVRLTRVGFRVVALEVEHPTAIRRTVALSEAVYEGRAVVEGVEARRVGSAAEALGLAARGIVPLLVDPECACLDELAPEALVDAIIAKRNLGTRPGMASVVVALGPGFSAPQDAGAVIETNRGHDLGRAILEGEAEADTGTPGIIAGRGAERVVHAAAEGRIEALREIGDLVVAGDPILAIVAPDGMGRKVMRSPLDGVLRGLIRPGLLAPRGLKVADVDPRGRREHCFSISDKARAISGGVLEALMRLGARPA